MVFKSLFVFQNNFPATEIFTFTNTQDTCPNRTNKKATVIGGL